MFQRNSYQIFDRSPISAVTIKVKPFTQNSSNSTIMRHIVDDNCAQSTYDVNDFIVPATENSAVTIATRVKETGHVLRSCGTDANRKKQSTSSIYAAALHKCDHPARVILPPSYRHICDSNTTFSKPRLCWFKLPRVPVQCNYQALDYVLFIKHYVEFPQLDLVRNNLIPDPRTKNDTEKCEYDPIKDRLCPKFRISKILEMIEDNPEEYKLMFEYGSLIEIKISWKCNLDKAKDQCQPQYKFQRLDHRPYRENPYQKGSNFLTARHFFQPDDAELHRVHTKIYNLHIVVSVTGEVGKFDLFLMTTSIGSFIGIFCAGTIACDLIAAFFTNFKSIKYDS